MPQGLGRGYLSEEARMPSEAAACRHAVAFADGRNPFHAARENLQLHHGRSKITGIDGAS